MHIGGRKCAVVLSEAGQLREGAMPARGGGGRAGEGSISKATSNGSFKDVNGSIAPACSL